MWDRVILCYVMEYYIISYCVMSRYTVSCYKLWSFINLNETIWTVEGGRKRGNDVLFSSVVLYCSIMLCCVVLCCALFYLVLFYPVTDNGRNEMRWDEMRWDEMRSDQNKIEQNGRDVNRSRAWSLEKGEKKKRMKQNDRKRGMEGRKRTRKKSNN